MEGFLTFVSTFVGDKTKDQSITPLSHRDFRLAVGMML
jgi:hypothetical protein